MAERPTQPQIVRQNQNDPASLENLRATPRAQQEVPPQHHSLTQLQPVSLAAAGLRGEDRGRSAGHERDTTVTARIMQRQQLRSNRLHTSRDTPALRTTLQDSHSARSTVTHSPSSLDILSRLMRWFEKILKLFEHKLFGRFVPNRKMPQAHQQHSALDLKAKKLHLLALQLRTRRRRWWRKLFGL